MFAMYDRLKVDVAKRSQENFRFLVSDRMAESAAVELQTLGVGSWTSF